MDDERKVDLPGVEVGELGSWQLPPLSPPWLSKSSRQQKKKLLRSVFFFFGIRFHNFKMVCHCFYAHYIWLIF